MKKRIAALLLSTVMAFSLTACGNSAKTEKADNKETKQTTEAVEDMSFDEMVDAAKGTTVTFYGWGGDDSLNDWLDNYYAPRLKEKYDITLERVPMDIDAILSQLSGEISTDKKDALIRFIHTQNPRMKIHPRILSKTRFFPLFIITYSSQEIPDCRSHRMHPQVHEAVRP